LTMIGAVRLDGPLVCSTLDGAVDGETFLAWVRDDLCPSLRPGDVVVMDNLPAHKSSRITSAVESAEARLIYLPPYSPDFNPIEPMWSKVKEALRSIGARTIDALGLAVNAAVSTVTAADCRGFFEHCGYATKNCKPL
jgi:transposase